MNQTTALCICFGILILVPLGLRFGFDMDLGYAEPIAILLLALFAVLLSINRRNK